MRRDALTCAAALLASGTLSLHAQTPIRDGQRATDGTSTIAGIVVTTDVDARPVRRARVTVNNAERTIGRTVVTDDNGTFEIASLPAGRYTLNAAKDGYVAVSYGAKRVGRPGTPLVLDDGQHVKDVILRLPRGAVITGMVLDENGQPLAGINVRATRSTVLNGQRQFISFGGTQVTDDRGVYRIYGLMPGEYIVAASGMLGSAQTSPEVHMITDAGVRRALRELRSPAMSARPGQPAPDPALTQPDDAVTVAYAPVYHPGVIFPDSATRVTLAAGEERSGVDVQMQIVRTAKIEGSVAAPAGVSPQVGVSLVNANTSLIGPLDGHFRMSRADAQGRFSFSSVVPGQYSLLARSGAVPPPERSGAAPGTARQPPYWAQADVMVEGQNISGVLLSLQPGVTIMGRVRFEGSTHAPPDDLSRVRVGLSGLPAQGEIRLGVSSAQIAADGTFSIPGVIPGRYRLTANVPSAAGTLEWTLESAMVDGQNVLDAPFEVQPGRAPGDIVVTFTDRITVLSGTIQNAAGRPAPDYFIIAFTTDRTKWTPQSRRVAAIRPSADGRYTFRGIPAGEYFLAAVDDVEQGEWYDPAFLGALVESAMKISIAAGEQKTQDLRLAAGR